MTGGWPILPDLSNGKSLGIDYTASHGTIVSMSVANTKGAWTQLVAVTPAEACFIVVQASASGSPQMTAASLDIGIGGPGAEVAIVSNLVVPARGSGSYLPSVAYYPLPLEIPAGARLSARAQGDHNEPSSVIVSVQAFSLGIGGGAQTVDTHGFNAATTMGTRIDPGGSSDTKGAWAQLTASTTYDIAGFVLAFDLQGDLTSAFGAAQYLIDVGVGAAASEVVVVPDLSIYSLRSAVGSGATTWSLTDLSGMSLANNNLTARTTTQSTCGVRSSQSQTTGKLYFEITPAFGSGGGVTGSQTVGSVGLGPVITGPASASTNVNTTIGISGVTATDSIWPHAGNIVLHISTSANGTVSATNAGSPLTGLGVGWSSADKTANITVNGITTEALFTSAAAGGIRSNTSRAAGSGKWYAEIVTTATSGNTGVGLAIATWTESDTNGLGGNPGDSNSVGLAPSGGAYITGSIIGSSAAYTDGDTLQIAVDMTVSPIQIYTAVNNGAWTPSLAGAGVACTGLATGPWFLAWSDTGTSGVKTTLRTDAASQSFAAPAGFSPWNPPSGDINVSVADSALATILPTITYTAGAVAETDHININIFDQFGQSNTLVIPVSVLGGTLTGTQTDGTVGAGPVFTGPASGSINVNGSLGTLGVTATDSIWPHAGSAVINVFTDGPGTVTGNNAGTPLSGSGTGSMTVTTGDANVNAVIATVVFTAGGSAGTDGVWVEVFDQFGQNNSIHIPITVTTGGGSSYGVGLANAAWNETAPAGLGGDLNSVVMDHANSYWLNNIQTTAAHDPYSTGDVIGIAVDLAAGLLWSRINGGRWNASGTANPATATAGFDFSAINAGPYFIAFGDANSSNDTAVLNAGSAAFQTAPPVGFSGWGSTSGAAAAWNSVGPPCSPYYPVPIKAGTRIAVRAQCSSTDAIGRLLGATLYGVRA